jgi:predicted RNase H-like nuclease (RuvC/YqgF family)
MNVQGIASAGVYSSEILGTQKKAAASDAQTSAVQTSTRASQDTYVPEDTSANESAGIYQLVSDGAGGQAISFDAPTQGAAPQAAAASQASDSTDSTDDTDDLEDEIDELEDERDELQQQLQATQDEQESAKIQKQIDQLDTQIQLKQSQLYASESDSES